MINRAQNIAPRAKLHQWILGTVHDLRETELEPQKVITEGNAEVENVIFQETSYILYVLSPIYF